MNLILKIVIITALLMPLTTVSASPEFSDYEVAYMASILAGETAPGCEECHYWIGCTIVSDARRYRGLGASIHALTPNRWRGFRSNPSQIYVDVIRTVITTNICNNKPVCRLIGNANDYRYHWTHYGNAMITGNQYGLVVCVPYPKEEETNEQEIRRSYYWGEERGSMHYPY